jgi:hypothetical protein
VTSNLPVEIPKKASERQRLEAEVDKLTVENKRLKLLVEKARALFRSAAHISSVAVFLKESEGL